MTKFSAFVTLFTELTIFVTLLGCSLGLCNATQYKFSHRVQAVATAIDIHLVPSGFSVLGPQIIGLMMSADIVRVDLLHGDEQVYILARNGSYRPVGSSDLSRELSVPLIKRPGIPLRLVRQDPMGNYFHSLMATAPLAGTTGLIIAMLLLAVRWLQQQLAGQGLLETRATCILNGERGSNILRTIYEWPPRASNALDMLFREIQDAREQHSRLDTLIHSYAAQDMKTGLDSRLLSDNQLATLLEDQEKVGTRGIVMMIRLSDFSMLNDAWGYSQVEGQFFTLTSLLSTFMMRYPGALLARYHRGDFAALLPHRTLKEVESIADQLIKAVNTLPNNKMLDHDDMIHIGICTQRSSQDTGRVMEHAESATRSAGLQGSNSWVVYDDSLPEKECDNVRWRMLIKQVLSRGGPRLYQKSAVTHEGQVHHHELIYHIFDGDEEVSSAGYTPMVLQFGLSEECDRLQISRPIPLLRYWPERNLTIQITVESLIHPRFQRWLHDTLIQCEKSQRKRIIIELAEADVGQYISRSQPVIRLVNALGVRVAINQTGLTLVSASWTKELNVELLELHPGLVRNIERRTENQLLVQSLVETCSGASTQVYATGIRSRSK